MTDASSHELLRSLHALEARARVIRERLRLVEDDWSAPAGSLAAAEIVIDARRRLARRMPETPFADPAFDILLDLYVAARRSEDRVMKACTIAAAVPQSTVTRWIGSLVAAGLVEREGDLHDRRRTMVRLTPLAIDLVHASLADVLTSLSPTREGASPLQAGFDRIGVQNGFSN